MLLRCCLEDLGRMSWCQLRRRAFHLVSTSRQQGGSEAEASYVINRHSARDDVEKLTVQVSEVDGLLQELKHDKETRQFAKQHLIAGKRMYRDIMRSFNDHVTSHVTHSTNSQLSKTVQSVLDGKADKNTLLPHFLSHARTINPLIGPAENLLQTSNLTAPPSWFPLARATPRRIIYHAGPTNSGKTHAALHKFKEATTAIYCAPLRLLAHEIFQRSNTEGAACDLLTGEEAQYSSGDLLEPASRLSCTVEMAFSSDPSLYDIAVIDEIQMIADLERGGAWTRALLGIPATEVHLCGHECVVDLVKKIVSSAGDTLEVQHYERLSPLTLSKKTLQGSYGGMKQGDCVVAFSRNRVFEISQLVERVTRQNCAIIYGDLPPAVRVKQADIFNDLSSKCDVMVATDAIGMGLNLNIGRIIFDSVKKFDGRQLRSLTPAHARQVAGRAGRYGKKHSKGLVTTFHQKDFRQLQRLLNTDVKKTKKAGLYPSVEQTKLFASFVPNAKLFEILTLFEKMAELDGKYFLCDLSKQIDLAYILKELEMTLEDMFIFTLAPVDEDKKKVVTAFIEFAGHFSEGREVNEQTLLDHLGSPPTVAKSSSNLAELECKYEVVKLYLWLSMRYPETFVDGEIARSLQEAIEDCIHESLAAEDGPLSLRTTGGAKRARHRTKGSRTVRHSARKMRSSKAKRKR